MKVATIFFLQIEHTIDKPSRYQLLRSLSEAEDDEESIPDDVLDGLLEHYEDEEGFVQAARESVHATSLTSLKNGQCKRPSASPASKMQLRRDQKYLARSSPPAEVLGRTRTMMARLTQLSVGNILGTSPLKWHFLGSSFLGSSLEAV